MLTQFDLRDQECFTACKKKEDTSPEIKTQLKSITGADARTFEYNADGTLRQMESNGKRYTYKYENGKIVTIFKSNNNEPDAKICQLTYDGNSVLKYFLGDNDNNGELDSLSYDAKRVIETLSAYSIGANQAKTLESIDSLFWKDGNLERVQKYDFDSDTRQLIKSTMRIMTYDDKKNPMYGIQGYHYTEIGYTYGRASVNNLTMEKIISKAGIVTYLGTMTMEYNDQGYVTKVDLESRGSVRTNCYHY